jgi:hypothetical protein
MCSRALNYINYRILKVIKVYIGLLIKIKT